MFDKIEPERAARIFFGCSPEDIHPVCLLTFSYTSYHELLEDVTEFSGWRKGFTGTYRGHKMSVIIPGMGSTAAGDTVAFLKYVNCKTIIYSGAAGGFGACDLGDIIVPTKAVIGEGFSQYYTRMREVTPDNELLQRVRKSYAGERIHFKPIFTIGSIAAQRRNLLLELERQGMGCIDIETSAIFTASSFFSISSIAVHFISDLPLKRSLLNSFTTEEYMQISQGNKRCMNLVLSLMCLLSGQCNESGE